MFHIIKYLNTLLFVAPVGVPFGEIAVFSTLYPVCNMK
jgi:hypothetical protein